MYELVNLYPNGGKEMLHFFHSLFPLSKPVMVYVLENTRYIKVTKGKFIRSPLDNTETIYFIVKGLMRGFIRDEGVEITTWINEENNVVGSIRNLGLDVDTEEYIQALEDTLLIAISRTCLDELYDRYPETNIIGRKTLEMYYREAEERAYLCRLPSAEKRYKRLAQTRKGLIDRVRLKYLASYLGMKKETLCRIRKKFKAL
ncbi:Crp/Fnr family transcriptional regulator [Sphingobacterium olei]|uniref:Crp/Fnr family transcriptional regulator n=1 Tax=Sphingobacterium olei TaxID=2571155 RepID=A0A4V5MM79_9SPHI|nr:Crp/Fnr family transcriptional regulator [Sphingobacterium olei]TJZ59948.1 Crp/Fnr family transcriptional regulator [Sphingobacterium olei]